MAPRRLACLCGLICVTVAGCGGSDSASDLAPTAAPSSTAPAMPATAAVATPTLNPTTPPTSTTAPPSPTPTANVEPTPTVPVASWGNAEIYVMNADGADQRRITVDIGYNAEPAWSPDGSRIALVVARDSVTAIAVMNTDASEMQVLSEGADSQPAWSPDGRQIAFSSHRDGHVEIYLMDADGSDERRVTESADGNSDPDWSPDGATIAYTSYVDGRSQLAVMDADGGNQRILLEGTAADFSPVWSPDGSRIAFARSMDYGIPQNYVVNADGADLRNLSNNAFYEFAPAWSPDGRSIAFARGEYSLDDIFLMDADGGNVRQLTDAPHGNSEPSWSPDSARIAFTSRRDGGQPVSCNWSSGPMLMGIESMEALIWMSHHVVVGAIVEQLAPAFGESEDTMAPSLPIFTDYLFEVDDQYRGHPAETLRIRQVGGKIGDCEQTTWGLETLEIGQRVLVFLSRDDYQPTLPEAYWVVGAYQGIFPVADDDTIDYTPASENQTQHMTLADVEALVQATLSGEPPVAASMTVTLEDAPLTPR